MPPANQFSPQIADFICSRIANGESIRKICADPDMPASSTIFKWLGEQKAFSEQYARARESQMEAMAEEILEIADDGLNDFKQVDGRQVVDQENINRSRLRVDTRKWLMSKLAPKKYGDRTVLAGDPENPINVSLADAISAARKRASERS